MSCSQVDGQQALSDLLVVASKPLAVIWVRCESMGFDVILKLGLLGSSHQSIRLTWDKFYHGGMELTGGFTEMGSRLSSHNEICKNKSIPTVQSYSFSKCLVP